MQVYGLIGYPLEHSFSQQYFNAKFEKERDADRVFKLFPLRAITEFPALIAGEKNIKGLAVTIPYKESIIQYVNTIKGAAEEVRAVNCLKISDNIITGYNTDVIGFERSFMPLLQKHHTGALILGTGGSSKAVKYVLKKLGLEFLVVTRHVDGKKGHINYSMINKNMTDQYPVIINCTPAGMFPDTNDWPQIPYQYLNNKNYLFDLIYNPEQTKFLEKGVQAEALVKNGNEMLLIQAEENWKIWNKE